MHTRPQPAVVESPHVQQLPDPAAPMRLTASLPPDPQRGLAAYAWVLDDTHHASLAYCGCSDAAVYRVDRIVYSVCDLHHVQILGQARRRRINHRYLCAG